MPGLAVCLVLLLTMAPVGASDDGPLVPNGGFEIDADADGMPDGWAPSRDQGQGAATFERSGAKAGQVCLKLNRTGGKRYVEANADIALAPLTRYAVSYWFKSAGKGQPQIRFSLRGRKGQEVGTAYVHTPQSAEWALHEAEIVTDKGTVKARMNPRMLTPGTLWLDEIAIRRVGWFRDRICAEQVPPAPLAPAAASKAWAKRLHVYDEHTYHGTTGVKVSVKDPTAVNGLSARIAPDAPPYFQCGIALIPGTARGARDVLPGLTYTLFGVFRIKKNGEAGTAFRTGVYNGRLRRYVARDMQPPAKAVASDAWQTYNVGTFVLAPNQSAYAGPTKNQANIAEIALDHFFLTPGDKISERLLGDIRAVGDPAVRFYFAAEKTASCRLSLAGQGGITLAFLLRRDPLNRAHDDTFTGLVLDYPLADGGGKRVLLPVGVTGKQARPGGALPTPWRQAKIDEVLPEPTARVAVCYRKITVDLAKHAPSGWQGRVEVTFLQHNSLDTWAGVITDPLRDGLKVLGFRAAREKGDLSGFDEVSSNDLTNVAKDNRFKRFIERLKAQLDPR